MVENARIPTKVKQLQSKGDDMKFRTERDELLQTLQTASRAADSRSGAIGLSALHLTTEGGVLEAITSNGDLMISTTMTVDSSDDSTVACPARLMVDIVKRFPPGAVEVSTDDSGIHISCGKSKFNLRTWLEAELLRLPNPGGTPATVDTEPFANGLAKVLKAASRDDGRPLLTGVLAEQRSGTLRLVATDSYRLALCDLDGQNVLGDEASVLIPNAALSEVQRLIGKDDDTIIYRGGERTASFDIGATVITTRLLDGQYPNYETLLPEKFAVTFTTDRRELIEAVKRVSIMVRDSTTPVRLSFADKVLNLSVESQEVGNGNDSVNGSLTGDALDVAFNSEYLLDALEGVTGDSVVIGLNSAVKPGTVRSETEDGSMHLLMPVRVS